MSDAHQEFGGRMPAAHVAARATPTIERVAMPYPRCACPVADPETRRVREKNRETFACPALARYRIDGVPMCRRHAGGTLITRLLGEASS